MTPATSGVALCDVTVPSMCNNSTPGSAGLSGGLAGYALTEGYDLATGLGSLNVMDFLNVAGTVPVLARTGTYLILSPDINETTIARDVINTSKTVTFEAIVGGNGMEIPTGVVQFYTNGAMMGGPVAIDASGFATTPAESFAAPGTYTISAQYLGSSDFAVSTSQNVTLQVTVSPTATTTTTLSLGSATGVLGGSTALRASVVASDGSTTAPQGNVQIFSNGLPVGAANSLEDGGTYSTALSLVPAGANSITAVFLGNQGLLGSRSAPQTFTVSKAQSSLQLGSSFSTVAAGAIDQYTVSVYSAGYSQILPTGTVEFFRDGVSFGTVALVKGQAVSAWQTYPGAEMVGITATYSGDTNYTSATSGTSPVTVMAGAPYTVSATTTTMQLYRGEGAPGSVFSVNVAQTSNFTGNVNLACTVQYTGTGTATDPPTCKVGSTFISFPLTYGVSSAITLGTTPPHAAASLGKEPRQTASTIALCSIVLGLLAIGRLRYGTGGLRSLAALTLLIVAIGCGGGGGGSGGTGGAGGGGSGGGGSGGGAPAMTGGTTPGSYAVVITPTNTAGLIDPAPITISLSVQ